MLRKILSSIMTIALLGVDIGCLTTSSKEEDKTDQNKTQENSESKEISNRLF